MTDPKKRASEIVKTSAHQMDDEELGNAIDSLVIVHVNNTGDLDCAGLGYSVRALFADDKPARGELEEVRSEIALVSQVVQAFYVSTPAYPPEHEATKQCVRLMGLLARERELMAKRGGGNG